MNDADARTPLSQLLASMTLDNDVSHVHVPDDWLQGRAIYGGLTAALCLQSIYDQHGRDLPPLRSVLLSFIGPAGPDVALRPVVVRQGKSTAFITVDMLSGDKIAARGTFCFGKARDSKIAHADLQAPQVAGPAEYESFFQRAGQTAPNFTQHFEGRFARGSMPVTQSDEPEYVVWLRHRDSDIDPVVVGLAALADALPPAAMASFSEVAPISTMTWMFDVLDDDPRTEDGWWLSQSVAEHSGDGYSSQAMRVWNRAGQPIVVGRQNVAIFH
ncbi:hypothetical protein T35B1_16601 [Salinisphaera shabanensis T35B1]|uniref:thioesterase family protein n=1 Tax=Salinisphaera shabanensis TaxID=180542 RepID=UPI003341301D